MSKFTEVRVSGDVVYAGKFFKVYRDVVRLPDGAAAVRDYIRHPEVLAMAADGRISDVKIIIGLFWTASRRQPA